VREASAGQSQFQQDLLKDGRLSFNEYRTAFLRYVSCIEDRGGKAEGQPVRTKRVKLEQTLVFPSGDGASVAAAIEGCRAENLSVVDRLWSMHVAPSKDELQRARESLAACLRNGGFPGVPEQPGPGELIQFWPGHGSAVTPATFYRCQEEIDTEYDLPGFGG
jgi:hypothetical protein